MNDVSLETVLFCVFMLVATGWRVRETFQKQGQVRGGTRMMWSFYALFSLSCVIFAGTVLEFFFVKRAHCLWASLLGGVVFVLANVLRWVAIRALGRFWSLHVEIRDQQPLIREGPYRYVRHPAYAAFVAEHIAVPLVGNAWWSLGVAVFLFVPMILWRIAREEAALVEKFGDRYRAYQREAGRLTPRWRALRGKLDGGQGGEP
jgi:protein-S-isoprenylcysteine O-methyltransferase Ste14